MRGPPGRRGFTIVEALIALAVLAVVVSALALTQVTTLRVGGRSERTSVATQAGIAELDHQRRLVQADFLGYWSDCGSGSGVNRCAGSSASGVTYEIEHAPSGYGTDGVIAIHVDVTEPAPAHFDSYVSCLDQAHEPTVVDPSRCPSIAPDLGP